MQDFEGRVAVATGTANPRGIGIATARRLAGLGCRIVLADLDGDGAEVRAAELREAGAEALAVRSEMGDHGSVLALAAATSADADQGRAQGGRRTNDGSSSSTSS